MKVDASTLSRNLRPLIDAGWVAMGPGADGRSRLVSVTHEGREKRQEAQRRWRIAQEAINEIVGTRRVVQLHALVDECLELLSPLPAGATDE
jgi:DNA-binding MarR family transcriptional regulator